RIEEIEEGTTFVEGYMADLARRSSAGYAEIRKYAAIGGFLFSSQVADQLSQLEQALDAPTHHLDPFEDTSGTLDAVTSVLKDLRPMAHRDLSLPARDGG